ncbi:MAG: hypothetical protein WC819_01180 [Parcubacteria group bacterium]
MNDQVKIFDHDGCIDKKIVGRFFDFVCNTFPKKTRGGVAERT